MCNETKRAEHGVYVQLNRLKRAEHVGKATAWLLCFTWLR